MAIGLVAAFASPSPTFIGKNTPKPFSSLLHEKPISSHSLKVEIRIHCIVLRTQRGKSYHQYMKRKKPFCTIMQSIRKSCSFYHMCEWVIFFLGQQMETNIFLCNGKRITLFLCVKMAFVLFFWLRQSTQFHLLLFCNWAKDKLVF